MFAKINVSDLFFDYFRGYLYNFIEKFVFIIGVNYYWLLNFTFNLWVQDKVLFIFERLHIWRTG